MKKAFAIALLILLARQIKAQDPSNDQPQYKTITLDTINIHGHVYNFDGSPAVGIAVSYKPNNVFKFIDYAAVNTNKDGSFEIKGIKPVDTLHCNGDYFFKIINKGSRDLNIYLPQPAEPVAIAQVSATRKHKKAAAIYKIRIPDEKGTGVFYDSEFIPSYPGGFDKFKQLLSSKVVYPTAAIDNNIEGTVKIGFTILRSGDLANFKILRGLGFGCDEAALLALKSVPKAKPGITSGRPFEAQYVVDVEFKLTN